MHRILRGDKAVGVALALFAFIVYLTTVSPSIGLEDAGELAAAAGTLGITHPTGYPLFSMLGRVFSILPLGDLRVIAKLNIMGALSCAAAVFLFYHLFLTLLTPFLPPVSRTGSVSKEGKGGNVGKGGKPLNKTSAPSPKKPEVTWGQRLGAATGVLVLAFSRVYWANAVTVEVYALHIVFFALVTLLFVRSLRAHLRGTADEGRLWIVFAYVFGLAFANHMMTVLLFPAFLYLYFNVHGFGKIAWIKIGKGIPLFVLGLTPYLYLPIRAATVPVMNWGNPATLQELWRHISGEQYRYKMFSSLQSALDKSVVFFHDLPFDFGYAPLIPAAIGLWLLFRKDQRMAIFSALIFVTGTFYAINYSFNDINFNLNAHIAVALWVAVGIAAMARPMTGTFSVRLIQGVAILLVLFPLALNHARVDRHDNYLVEDYTRNLLESLEPNALLITDQYDHFGAATTYLQFIEGVRPDVIVLVEFGIGIPEHDIEMAQRYPGYRDAFPHASLKSFRVHTREQFATLYQNIKSDFVGNLGKRPLYITYTSGDVMQNFDSLQSIPEGMVMRLFKDTLPKPAPIAQEFYHPPPKNQDTATIVVQQLRARAYTRQAVYRARLLGDTTNAMQFLRMAVAVDPKYIDAQRNLRILQGY